jgi:hypothetical protein
MKAALAVVVLLASGGCVRAAETTVREQASAAFACADYALSVVEVGPDVYRASGCGQELIYACKPSAPPSGATDEAGDEAVITCAREPR